MKKVLCKGLVAVVLILTTATAFATSQGQERGGGDEIGIEFQSLFLRALRNLQSENSPLARSIAATNPLETLASLKVLVVDEPLRVSLSDISQDSIATNDRQTNTIRVQRARWRAIRNPTIKEGIALHEILSLLGVESTGTYTLSGQYVARFNLSVEVVRTGRIEWTPVYPTNEDRRAANQRAMSECSEMQGSFAAEVARINQAFADLRTQAQQSCSYEQTKASFQAMSRLGAEIGRLGRCAGNDRRNREWADYIEATYLHYGQNGFENDLGSCR